MVVNHESWGTSSSLYSIPALSRISCVFSTSDVVTCFTAPLSLSVTVTTPVGAVLFCLMITSCTFLSFTSCTKRWFVISWSFTWNLFVSHSARKTITINVRNVAPPMLLYFLLFNGVYSFLFYSFHHTYIWQISIFLSVVQAIADYEFVRYLKSYIIYFHVFFSSLRLIQERAQMKALWVALS